ncbi:MAG: helix-turn-helix domain-containing protein [Flavobacteriales bacterium]|nr:helix-turn-helix domain-containing protein [Flavobacteriales bacterium]
MQAAELYIRNMVSSRCIVAVRQMLKQLDMTEVERISLGRAVVGYDDDRQLAQFIDALPSIGFSLVEDDGQKTVEMIKAAAIELFYHGNNANSLIRNSDHLSERTGMPYHQLSRVFSEQTNTTLEKYIILLKIERVKELLSYKDLSLSEISYQMGYSSVQYLSNQFKQVTGVTPKQFKEGKGGGRIPLDRLV